MIVCKLTSGFGNQLFQYACAYSVSRRGGVRLIVDALSYDKNYDRPLELDKLCVSAKIVTSKAPKVIRMGIRLLMLMTNRYYKESTYYKFDSQVFKQGKNTYYQGFWQSDKYFREYRDEIIKEFQPKVVTAKMKEYMQLYGEMESCAVHIRRGDYVKINGCIDVAYYEEAMEVMHEKKKGCVFVFFSDDIEWVKRHFSNSENTVFFDEKKDISDLEEFYIMSYCRNQIIANSSFSWWAAYLNTTEDKIVVAPEIEKWSGDFYPENWIKLKAKKLS